MVQLSTPYFDHTGSTMHSVTDGWILGQTKVWCQ